MPSLKILINGASVAGPTLAYWLLEGGDVEITLVERAPSLRVNGQSIDIRNSAVKIMQMMGIEDEVRSKTTKEEGLAFYTSKGKRVAVLGATGDTDRQSFTSEFEIFRGDLSEIIYNRVKDRITTIFDDYVSMMRQDPDGVYVEFTNGTKPAKYDLVIGADGLGSKIRSMAFNTTTRQHINPMLCYFAYYTIKEDMLKGDKKAIWYNASGGRVVMVRPDPQHVTRANIGVCFPENEKGRKDLDSILEAEKKGPDALKAALADLMKDSGYMSDTLIKGMYEADDFYSSEVAQIKTDRLFKDRVVLVGDAGYCPSPMTGMGTSLAMIGCYLLAGEISKFPNDIPRAFQAYEKIMLPFAKKIQQLPPFMPRPFIPQTEWGIRVRNFILWVVISGRVDALFAKLASFTQLSNDHFPLPDYQWSAGKAK